MLGKKSGSAGFLLIDIHSREGESGDRKETCLKILGAWKKMWQREELKILWKVQVASWLQCSGSTEALETEKVHKIGPVVRFFSPLMIVGYTCFPSKN